MARLASRLPGRALHALIESPLGVESAFEIASAGIGLGEADLRSALGVATAEHLGWQRARIVNAAAAAGLEPPAMSVYADVRDLEGLRASCEAGRASGFVGRAAILPVIREAFTPSGAEVARAREVLQGFATASETGGGTFVLAEHA